MKVYIYTCGATCVCECETRIEGKRRDASHVVGRYVPSRRRHLPILSSQWRPSELNNTLPATTTTTMPIQFYLKIQLLECIQFFSIVNELKGMKKNRKYLR